MIAGPPDTSQRGDFLQTSFFIRSQIACVASAWHRWARGVGPPSLRCLGSLRGTASSRIRRNLLGCACLEASSQIPAKVNWAAGFFSSHFCLFFLMPSPNTPFWNGKNLFDQSRTAALGAIALRGSFESLQAGGFVLLRTVALVASFAPVTPSSRAEVRPAAVARSRSSLDLLAHPTRPSSWTYFPTNCRSQLLGTQPTLTRKRAADWRRRQPNIHNGTGLVSLAVSSCSYCPPKHRHAMPSEPVFLHASGTIPVVCRPTSAGAMQ